MTQEQLDKIRAIEELMAELKKQLEELRNSPKEVWKPKDKEPIWCWDDCDPIRVISFWDSKNLCCFFYDGTRDGAKWDNYAKVEHIEQWMLDVQAELED